MCKVDLLTHCGCVVGGRAAVVHYNGNAKPWLEIAMAKFKGYWTKYVKWDHPFLQQCNFQE